MCRVTRELPAPLQLPNQFPGNNVNDFHRPPMPSSLMSPALNPSTTHNVTVKTADNRLETKRALVSRQSNVYELGPILREGKFGQIRYACILKKTPGCNASPISVTETPSSASKEEFEIDPLSRPVAIKIYSVEKLKDIRGNVLENPWQEIEIQEMISQLIHSQNQPQRLVESLKLATHPIESPLKTPVKVAQKNHLLTIVETCIVDQSLFMIMPFYSGGDLLDLIENRFMGPMPVIEAKRMFFHVLSGLSLLHRHGVVHRDISIENILYDDESKSYALSDFGMAMRLSRDPLSLHNSGHAHAISHIHPVNSAMAPSNDDYLPVANAPLAGKEGYIAPELWRRESLVDLRASDVWSLGIVLFMVLTGSAPLQRAVEFDPYYSMIASQRLFEMVGMSNPEVESNGCLVEGLALVQGILNPNPRLRPTAMELLNNCWLDEVRFEEQEASEDSEEMEL